METDVAAKSTQLQHRERSAPNLHKRHGFPFEILSDSPDPKYLCSICHLILRNPIQSFCGHRFCRCCFEESVRAKKNVVCESCRNENSTDEYRFLLLDQTFPDNATKREFSILVVKCPTRGCDWTGLFKQLEDHENICPYQAHQGLYDHHEDELIKLTIQRATFPLWKKLENVENLSKNTKSAQEMTAKAMMELKNQYLVIQQTSQQIVTRSSRSSTADGSLDQMSGEIIIYQQKIITFEQTTGVLNQQMEKCLRVLEVMMRQAHQKERAITEQKEAIKSLESKSKAIERTLLIKDAALADMNMRLQYLELTSYDGILLWKISDFRRRCQQAVSGELSSFYSPCFYTSRQGYKMCGRVYLNGDGMGKGTHISLFFVIMRGTYDALLPWSFRQKVTLTLLDQSKKEQHITDAFRPDPASSSFKRPTNEMNVASGCPMFMPINQLEAAGHAYVKDDAMFIKIIVDTHDLN